MQAVRAHECHAGLAEKFKRVSELRKLKVLSYNIKVFYLYPVGHGKVLKGHEQDIISPYWPSLWAQSR